MLTSKVKITSIYRALVAILFVLVLALPASATWKPLAGMPAARSNAAVETINGIVYVAGGYNAGGEFNPAGVQSNDEHLDDSGEYADYFVPRGWRWSD